MKKFFVEDYLSFILLFFLVLFLVLFVLVIFKISSAKSTIVDSNFSLPKDGARVSINIVKPNSSFNSFSNSYNNTGSNPNNLNNSSDYIVVNN